MAFKTSDNGVNFLKSQEGCRLTAYKLEGETYYTIGYGHYGADVYAGMTITEAQAEQLLRQDLVRFENGVNEIAVSKFPSINQNQFDALISYSYNRGLGDTDGSNGLRQLIYNSSTLAEVSANFVVYWGSAEAYKDSLIARRKREQTLFNTPVAETVTFTPRLDSTGIEGSFYYYSQNPFYTAGYGLPNCTCYAWGRFWEISDKAGDGSNKPTLPTGDAGTWYPNVTGYEKGQTPKLGAVICWSKSGEAGHVAIVEQILENGDIVTSNSAWQSTFFYTKTIYKADNYNFGNYVFQGFIYNPYVTSDTGGGGSGDDNTGGDYKPPTKKRKGYNFVLFNRKRRLNQWIGANY